jgi:cephalosporin-C deacetylase-like acetyl esterase
MASNGPVREDVEFLSDGTTCRGWYYPPEKESETSGAVVLAGGWCYVREVVMPAYASLIARRGLGALVIDYRNFGASDGDDRLHIDPWAQITDYQSALSYLAKRPDVDPERLGVWGISYSGGHVMVLAAIDARVKAIVSIIPVVDGYRNMRRVHGTVGFRRLKAIVEEDRVSRQEGKGRLYLPHATAEPWHEMCTWPFPESFHTFNEIKATVAPLYEGKSSVESVELLMRYSVAPFLPRILDTPVLMLVAEDDDLTLWDLEIEAYNSLPVVDKRLEILRAATHMKLYSDQGKLGRAAALSAGWLADHLG